MAKNSDELKGRLKQAAGDVTGNDSLKREGRADERSGKLKRKANQAIDFVRQTLGHEAK